MNETPLLDWMEEKGAGRRNRKRAYQDSASRHPSQQQRVLDHLLSIDGATREEISHALRLPLASVCGRVNKLLELGLIIETNLKRATMSGCQAVVVMAKKGNAK